MSMTPEDVESFGSLARLQLYVGGVEYAEGPSGIDLNHFRGFFVGDIALADAHLLYLGLPLAERDRAWLTVPSPRHVARVVINRSARYQNRCFPWDRVCQKYHDDAVFVGTRQEHEAFCKVFGLVPFEPTANFLELAEVIAGCELFVGNQSAPYAVAEGLKVRTLQETFPPAPNCVFRRENATYGWDERVELPELGTSPVAESSATSMVVLSASRASSDAVEGETPNGSPTGCGAPGPDELSDSPSRIKRVAVIFDDEVRPDTTGVYCLRALRELVEVEHFRPKDLAKVPRDAFDAYLYIDDGLEYPLLADLRPSALWAIDLHIRPERLLRRIGHVGVIFAAQHDGVQLLQRHGVDCAGWLPLACDPLLHRPHDTVKEHDVCFVAHMVTPGRRELASLVGRRFPRSFVGQRYFDDMARTYSASKLVLNLSVAHDVNMRVFEAMASGSLLITDDLTGHGLDRLFIDGTHLVTYVGFEDLIRKAEFYLENDLERERIAAAGREEALARHTYRHRMAVLLDHLSHRLATPAVRSESSVENADAIARSDVGDGSGLTSIVILTFNELPHTRRCLESVRRHTARPFELVVVDNGSSDGTVEYLRSLSDLRLIENEVNRGFPAAANQGIVASRGNEVVLLNNDTIVTHGWFERLASALSSSDDVGLVGPCSNNVPGPQRVSTNYPDPTGADGSHGLDEFAVAHARRHAARVEDADVLVGFCLLVRRDVFSKVGLLDEAFGIGTFEDYDLCRRAAATGYRSVIAVDAFVHHVGSATFRGCGIDPAPLLDRNGEVFRGRWSERPAAIIAGRTRRTTIVIVTFDQIEHTRRCIDSVRRCTQCDSYDLVVVDNGSTDGTREYLSAQPDVRMVQNEDNRGFSAAANQGIRSTGGGHVLLLNNDVVVTPGWLTRLTRAMDASVEVGLVGPCSDRVSGPQQVTVDYADANVGDALDHFAQEWASRHAGRTDDVERLVGFCLLVRRDVVDRIGLLDERFGIGNFEDDDYCRRVRAAGLRCVIARDAFVHHHGSATFHAAGVDYAALMARNRRLFDEKWGRTNLPEDDESDGRRGPTTASMCMIARDSSRTIGAALRSVRPWVDEMIVVDTGSGDHTAQVAESAGAKVFRFAWCDDFSAARNESLRHAAGDWVFWMDSDDTIDAANGRKLRELVDGPHDDRVLAYVMQVHCPVQSDPGRETAAAAIDQVTVVDHVKLFRNRPDLRFEGRIHEQILPAVRHAGGEVAWTELFVTHSGSDQSPDGRRRKWERDLRLLELELRDRPDHTFVLFNLGMTYADMGDHSRAADYLEQSLRSSSPGESHVRKVYALLAAAYHQQGRETDAWETCRSGLTLYSRDAELLFYKGILSHRLGRLDEAADAYRTILSGRSERYFASFDRGITGAKSRHNLAVVYTDMGRLSEAEREWRRLLDADPVCSAAWQNLCECLLSQGRTEAVRQTIDRMRQVPGLSVDTLLAEAKLARHEGSPPRAIELLRAADAQGGDADPRALRELCRLCFDSGDVDEATSLISRLTRVDPTDPSAWHNLGTLKFRQRSYDEAITAYRESLRLRPRSAATHELLDRAISLRQEGGVPAVMTQ